MNYIPGEGGWSAGRFEMPPMASVLTCAQRHALQNSPIVTVTINGEVFNIPGDVLLSFLSIARMSFVQVQEKLRLDLQLPNIHLPSIRLAFNWIGEACNGIERELPTFLISHDPINMVLAAAALGLPFDLLRIRPSIEALFDLATIPDILQLSWKAGQENATYVRDVLILKLDSIIRTEQQHQAPEMQAQTLDAVWATLDMCGVLQLSRDAHDANATCLRDVLLNRFCSHNYLNRQSLDNKFRALGVAADLGLGPAETALEQNMVHSSDVETLEFVLQRAGDSKLGRVFWETLRAVAVKLTKQHGARAHECAEIQRASKNLRRMLHEQLSKL